MQVHVVPKGGIDGKKVNFFCMTQGDVIKAEGRPVELMNFGAKAAWFANAKLVEGFQLEAQGPRSSSEIHETGITGTAVIKGAL
jgi:hypothetical protein